MKTIQISLEHDIKRNPEYINTQSQYHKTLQNIKSEIRNIFHSGKISERKYSIRHDLECENKEADYINKIAEIDYQKHETMYNELLHLKKENIALKKAFREINIKVELTQIKYYGDSEEII